MWGAYTRAIADGIPVVYLDLETSTCLVIFRFDKLFGRDAT